MWELEESRKNIITTIINCLDLVLDFQPIMCYQPLYPKILTLCERTSRYGQRRTDKHKRTSTLNSSIRERFLLQHIVNRMINRAILIFLITLRKKNQKPNVHWRKQEQDIRGTNCGQTIKNKSQGKQSKKKKYASKRRLKHMNFNSIRTVEAASP